jgi:glycosyltransferase involved in cell wall biosynthesis
MGENLVLEKESGIRRTINRMLLFTNRTEGHSHERMLADLGEGLAALGFDVRVFIVKPDGSDLGPFMNAVLTADPARTLLVDINGRMRLREVRRLPCLIFLIDHPFQHIERLDDSPPSAVIGYLDRTHRGFLDALDLGRRLIFLPHGGPEPDPAPPLLAERPIDLLFVGRLLTSPRISDLREGLADNPPAVREAVLATAEAVAAGEPLFDAFQTACAAAGLDHRDFDRAGWAVALGAVESWVEAWHRHRLLAALAGQTVHLVGAVRPDFFDGAPDHIRFLGPRSFDECLSLMRESRMVLNCTECRPGGSHERIWYAMAAGCAVATDRSRFVAETFRDGESILFLPSDPALIADRISEALADPARLQRLTDTARPLYAAGHTWRQRAGIIDAAVNGDPAQ